MEAALCAKTQVSRKYPFKIQFKIIFYRNPHDYSYLTNPEHSVCSQSPVSLLILVTSGLHHHDRRSAIRDTWGSQINLVLKVKIHLHFVILTLQEKHSAKIIFLMGTTTTTDSDLETDLAEEIAENNDVVREDFLDTYKNLTLKTLAGIKWADQYCSQADFVMKTDDDMYVNLDNIMAYLHREFGDGSSEKVITGCVKNDPNGPHRPLSAGGQPAPALPFKSVHPLFMAGAGYVISGNNLILDVISL